MADELDATLNEPSDAEKRIKQLSGKVKEEAEARVAETAAREAAEKRAQEAERLASFNEGFADIVAETPAARELKDQMKEKVLGGMSIEDAKFAVLGKAGMLGGAQHQETQSPAGGSAPTTPAIQKDKSAKDMSTDEKRAILEQNLIWQ